MSEGGLIQRKTPSKVTEVRERSSASSLTTRRHQKPHRKWI